MPTDRPSHAAADPAQNGHKTLGKPATPLSRARPQAGAPDQSGPAEAREGARRGGQNRVADKITAFSGSMLFVYIHIIWFGCWIGFGVEDYPFGLLTMIVSLEAIFLSTFVMISQNRADARRQVIADQQWKTVQEEDKQNVELLDLSKQILKLTKEVRSLTDRNLPNPGPAPGGSPQ